MTKMKNVITKILEYLTYILLLQFTIVIFLQVILRYFFDITLVWSDEFTRYSLIWLVFLGTAVLFADNSHIRISFLVDLLPGKIKSLFELLAKFLCIVFVAVVSIFSFDYIITNLDVNSITLQIPMGILYSIFPISSIFVIFFILIDCIEIIKNILKKPEVKR